MFRDPMFRDQVRSTGKIMLSGAVSGIIAGASGFIVGFMTILGTDLISAITYAFVMLVPIGLVGILVGSMGGLIGWLIGHPLQYEKWATRLGGALGGLLGCVGLLLLLIEISNNMD